MVSRASGRPAYLQVADALREQIRDGTYPPGAQLPTERALMETWDISSKTVRAALDQLRAEGLVVSRQGVGVFVREQKARRRTTADMVEPGAARGWYSVIARAGATPASRTTVTQGPCPPEVAEQLGIEPGTEVMIRDRVMRVEGQPPDQLATSYYTLDVAAQVPQLRDPTKGGQLNALEAAFGPIHHLDVITARMPDQRERELLDLPPGVPVVVLNGTTFDQQGQVLTHIVKAVASDRLELAYRYGRGLEAQRE
jgi:GntR family transcriptional regulator